MECLNNIKFTVELLPVISRIEVGNFVVSPLVVQLAVSTLSTDANPAVTRKLEQCLSLQETTTGEDLQRAFFNYMKSIEVYAEEKNGVSMTFDTRLFIHKEIEAETHFDQILQSMYCSSLKKVDYNDAAECADEINYWIKKKSKRKIKMSLKKDYVGPGMFLIVNSACLFEAKFATAFTWNPGATKPFRLMNKAVKQVAFMTVEDYFPVLLKLDGQNKALIVKIPYQDKRFSLVLVVPPLDELGAFTKALTAQKIHSIMGQLKPMRVHLEIPRFKVKTVMKMDQTLRSFGCPLFDKNKDYLSGICKIKQINLNHVVTNSYFCVEEHGLNPGTLPDPRSSRTSQYNTIFMMVDHPFLAYVWDEKFHVILLVTRILDPTQS